MKKQKKIAKKNIKSNKENVHSRKSQANNMVTNATSDESWEDNYGFGDFSYRMPKDFEN